jgi:large subunit ribosomal protein L25
MQRVELEVRARERLGKGPNRRLRAQGQVPAVLYGRGKPSVHLAVAGHTLERMLSQGLNQLIDLAGAEGAAGRLVLVKEVQRDPVSQDVLHCDFYEVDTSEKIQVSVPLHLEGKAVGVEMGGVLDTLVREIEVQCLPLQIPDSLQIDVSALEIGDALHASDLTLPANVELMIDETQTLVHVIAPRVEVEEEPEEEEEAEGEEAAEGEAEAESAKDETEKSSE